jgi:hypothetical protein
LEISNIETTGPPILEKHLCFALAHGRSHLLAELNEGLFAVQHSGEYDELFLKWFSVHEHQKRIGKLIKYVVLIIALYTSVVTETLSPSDEFFGVDRFIKQVCSRAGLVFRKWVTLLAILF